MGEVQVQVTPSQPQSIQVGIKNVKNSVQIEENPSHYYSTLAKLWATNMDGLVQNEDYSSKYWAKNSQSSAEVSQAAAETAANLSDLLNTNYNTYSEELSTIISDGLASLNIAGSAGVEGINNAAAGKVEEIENAVIQGVEDINRITTTALSDVATSKTDAINSIETVQTTALAQIGEAGTNEYNKIITTGVDGRATVDLSNLSAVGEKHFLNKTQLTNCVLEIPQRVNLVDNGTNIIIKAGTIGIQPNGFEDDGTTPKFDYITVTADITLENNQTTTLMLGLNGAQNVYRTPINRCFSGPTAPASQVNLAIWYDTSTNLVKRYVNSAWEVANYTLPLGILNYTASGTSGSIQQVFNGFGYIGSSLWIDKGVRMLIPNYRNEDGTLKNQDFTTEKIYLTYFASNYTRVNGKLVFLPDVIFDNIDIWTGPKYDSAKNIIVSSAEKHSMIILTEGGNTVENGVIQSLNIPQTVSLADNQYLEGFWVKKYAILLSSTTVGTYTIDLTSYLPNDNQAYEILLKQSMYNTNSSNAALFVETNYIQKSVVITSNSGSTTNYNTFSVPVGNNHILKYYLEGVSPNALLVEALAYKRTK